MRDAVTVVGACISGGMCAAAVVIVSARTGGLEVRQWLERAREDLPTLLRLAPVRGRVAYSLELAGWHETPERVTVLTVALATCAAAIGGALSPAVAALGFVSACAAVALALHAGIERRRRRMAGELVPLLELFTLELSGGGSPLAALGSVCVQVDSELACDLRRMLIASQIAGSTTFDARLLDYAARQGTPALGSLATILAASRDYGTGASQGVRALATDLRRAQRRELIEQSRRALNNVLLPAAVAVLLPFLGVLMFPAAAVLQKSLR